MKILGMLGKALREPSKKYEIEDQNLRLQVDLKIIANKPEFLKTVLDIQNSMVASSCISENENELNLELGAGVIPIRKHFPHVKSTDVVAAAHLDGVLDATNLDLESNSVQNLFLQNTFHHIPDPQAFFDESLRVLKKGGRIVIVDPYHNKWSSFLYPKLFKTETFDRNGSWKDASDHAMIGANQALTYIVFRRDLDYFKSRNPNLKMIFHEPLNSGLRYLLTGGLNFRQLAPRPVLSALRLLEYKGFMPKFTKIHWIVVLEKS
jgi:SAM-dependent methyltransferase